MYFNYKQIQNKIKLEVASGNLSSSLQILWLYKSPLSISNFCSLPPMITNNHALHNPFQIQMGESYSFHKWVDGTQHILKLTLNAS